MSRLSRLIKDAIADRTYGTLQAHTALRPFKSLDEINYFFHVIPAKKLIYIEIPKAGSTTIKSLLSRSEYGINLRNSDDYHHRMNSKLLSPSEVGAKRFGLLLRDPEALIFAVVRNPFSRLRSCYLDKFAGKSLYGGKDALLDDWIIGRYADRLSNADLAANRMSFESFVSYACSTAAARINTHWSLMSDIIPAAEDVDVKIVKLESMNDGLAPILNRLEATDEIRNSLQRPLNATEDADAIQWDRTSLQKVQSAYAKDFVRFQYDPTIPI